MFAIFSSVKDHFLSLYLVNASYLNRHHAGSGGGGSDEGAQYFVTSPAGSSLAGNEMLVRDQNAELLESTISGLTWPLS